MANEENFDEEIERVRQDLLKKMDEKIKAAVELMEQRTLLRARNHGGCRLCQSGFAIDPPASSSEEMWHSLGHPKGIDSWADIKAMYDRKMSERGGG
jgi:hypothetical protein